MALLDVLNREEASYFTEALKAQVQAFNRDFESLFNNKVKLAQPAFNHLSVKKIKETIPVPSAHMIITWEGECPGSVITAFKRSDVKILRGLLMMMQTSAIQGSLAAALTDEERTGFKEIAEQVRNSHEKVLREIVTIDLKTALKNVEFYEEGDLEEKLKSIFIDEEYLSHTVVMKIVDFPDSSIVQYYPVAMMKKLFELEKVRPAIPSAGNKKGIKTVLIVDDDANIRRQIKVFLKDQELAVVETDDGVKALQLLTRMKIDLVFLGMEIPHMDGFEICKRIQGHPHLKHIPVIACSAQSSKENVVKAITHGARGFLVKPITAKEQIEQKIKQYLR
jgi:CheY-like chemotaxis protein